MTIFRTKGEVSLTFSLDRSRVRHRLRKSCRLVRRTSTKCAIRESSNCAWARSKWVEAQLVGYYYTKKFDILLSFDAILIYLTIYFFVCCKFVVCLNAPSCSQGERNNFFFQLKDLSPGNKKTLSRETLTFLIK